jgi:hypothetical protein
MSGISNCVSVFRQSRDWERALARNYWPTIASRISTLASRWQHSPILAAGAFCALSPNNTEANNLIDLGSCLISGDRAVIRTYTHCKRRALAILSGAAWPDAILGQKTRAMWHNICWPDDPAWVTVDGHMFSVWHGRRFTMDQARITPALYAEIAAGITQASKGSGLSPCQYQACLWLTWKRLHRIVYNPQLRLDFGDRDSLGVEAI